MKKFFKEKISMPSKKTTLLTSIALLAGIVIAAAFSHFFLGPDNWIEERAENYIESKTHLSIDFTPSSPE